VVPDVLKDHNAFIFKCQAVIRLGLLHPLVIRSSTLDPRHYQQKLEVKEKESKSQHWKI